MTCGHLCDWRIVGMSFVTMVAFVGCHQDDAGNYQTFQQKQQSGSVFPNSFEEEEQAFLSDQPLTAEITPEEIDPDVAPEPPVDALAPVNYVDSTNVGQILQAKPVNTSAPSSPGVMESTGAITTDKDQPVVPRKVEILVKSRNFRTEGTPKALRVNFDDLDLLKVLNMDPVTPDAASLMPTWLSNLDGQTIRLRGFMFPTFESTGIERFVLARDAEKCCFGPNAKVYDLIAVEMKPGKTCDYIHLRPFDVIGKLRIDIQSDKDQVLGLYHIEDAELVQ